MHTECQPGLVLFNQTVDFAVFLVWMPPTDPQQHTGESLVFVHCVVLKIKLLFLMSYTKCDACTKHDAMLDGIRKNSLSRKPVDV